MMLVAGLANKNVNIAILNINKYILWLIFLLEYIIFNITPITSVINNKYKFLVKKLIINAGISKVIVRGQNDTEYDEINVEDWIEQDDLLDGKITYW